MKFSRLLAAAVPGLVIWASIGMGATAAVGFQPIFDGRTLKGWLGQNMSFWSVEEGAITGTISPEHAPKLNQYLVWQGGLIDDFELKLTFRLRSTNSSAVNGGFQFRSRRLPNGDVAGYQVDNNYNMPWKARLYDEFGRHDLALQGERTVFDAGGTKHTEALALEPGADDFRLDEWHEYHPDGSWNSALISKRGNHDVVNFCMFSTDLGGTPGPDIGFEVHTEKGFVMTSFPVSRVDAKGWLDLIGRYDGRTLQLLCNGRVMSAKPCSGALTENSELLLLGAETYDGVPKRFFSGEMEAAAIWPRALTDGEIARLTEFIGK